jgi:hypothetical protein
MSRSESLVPLFDLEDQLLVEANADIENYIKRTREGVKERIKQIAETRQALALLDAANIDFRVPYYTKGAEAQITLGFFSNSKKSNRSLAKQLRDIRVALGCSLGDVDKSIEDSDKRLLKYSMKAKDFNVRVTFIKKLPKAAKCKMVRQTTSYVSLVCDIS